MSLEGRRVLVTGGTGFIGGRAAERLVFEHSAAVRVLVRNPGRAVRVARLPVELVVGDLTDADAVGEAVAGCDLVLHCAHDMSSPRGHRTSGYHGTQVLGRAAVEQGVRRLVHLSSLAVYGPTPDGDLDETAEWRPTRDRYTAAKRAGERVVLDLHRTQGLPVVVLQPTIVYGPFGGAWTAGRISDLRTGLVPLVDGGKGLCNAVYVDDVVDAMLLAAQAGNAAVGERFLVSAAEPVTWRDFYAAFEDALGSRATMEIDASQLSRLARLEHRRARSQVRGLLGSAARDALRRRETVEALLDLPSIRALATFAGSRLPERRWQSLKDRLRGAAATPPAEEGGPPRKLHVPAPPLAALYSSSTRVRIDKARALLGYDPRFDFSRGMALTVAWLRWARLVNQGR